MHIPTFLPVSLTKLIIEKVGLGRPYVHYPPLVHYPPPDLGGGIGKLAQSYFLV